MSQPYQTGFTGGPFSYSWDSLKAYRCPEWFRDAKFGLWSVWGPQSVPMQGDWYARNLYREDSEQYKYHVAQYGHPSQFGYKDIIPLWKGENWDPARLMGLFLSAGAKYFVVMANHHDNYDLWDSKYQPRWNSVKTGPKKDVVRIWRDEALKAGLRFGITEHQARSYSWLQTSHGADATGPLANVPYDGADKAFEDLYHPPFENSTFAYPPNPPESWVNHWLQRSWDCLATYKPDLYYFDGGVPFGDAGMKLVADYYNANALWHGGGETQAVQCVKDMPDHGTYVDGTCVQDVERGVIDYVSPKPWQTDTCVGDWFYKKNIAYKTAKDVIQMLVDIVSKNGNLLLNVPLSPDGVLDAEVEETLAGIGRWLDVNGEAIYETRPWTVFGEGAAQASGDHFGENGLRYDHKDIRFTTKRNVLYATALGVPDSGVLTIRTLAENAPGINGEVLAVSWLVTAEKLTFRRTSQALEVCLPPRQAGDYTCTLKIEGLDLSTS